MLVFLRHLEIRQAFLCFYSYKIEYNIFKRQYSTFFFFFEYVFSSISFVAMATKCGEPKMDNWCKTTITATKICKWKIYLVCWISFTFGVLFKSNNFGALFNYLDSILMRFYLILFAAAVVVCLISFWFMHKIPLKIMIKFRRNHYELMFALAKLLFIFPLYRVVWFVSTNSDIDSFKCYDTHKEQIKLKIQENRIKAFSRIY